MNSLHTADFATRLRDFHRRCNLMVVICLVWLFGFGFLLLYVYSLIDPRTISGFVRTAIFVTGGAFWLLPPIIVSKDSKKWQRQYDLFCQHCKGDLAVREVIDHVLLTSMCPYCKKSLKEKRNASFVYSVIIEESFQAIEWIIRIAIIDNPLK